MNKSTSLDRLRKNTMKDNKKHKKEILDKIDKLKIKLYDGEPVYKEDGISVLYVVLYEGKDEKGEFCIKQCTCCTDVVLCRECITKFEKKIHCFGGEKGDYVQMQRM